MTVVPTRLLICSCGAVLLDVPAEFPAKGPRYVDRIEFAAHAAHATAAGLADPVQPW